MRGERLNLRCFLQGVEVPCVSATVQVSLDSPAAASIQLVPTPSTYEIMPRTGVELFYWDDYKEEYRLLFSGEVVGIQSARAEGQVSVMIQALDDSSYWDTAYQYYIDWGRGTDWLFRWKANFVGAGQNLFSSLLQEHKYVLSGIVSTPPRTMPHLRGLTAGIVHLLERVGGVTDVTPGVNDFFTAAERLRRLLRQVSASELDDSSQRIFGTKVFWEWLLQGLSSEGQLVTIRDMIKLLFRYIFHNVAPNPAAKYDPPGDKRTIRYKVTPSNLGKIEKEIKELAEEQEKLYKEIKRLASFQGGFLATYILSTFRQEKLDNYALVKSNLASTEGLHSFTWRYTYTLFAQLPSRKVREEIGSYAKSRADSIAKVASEYLRRFAIRLGRIIRYASDKKGKAKYQRIKEKAERVLTTTKSARSFLASWLSSKGKEPNAEFWMWLVLVGGSGEGTEKTLEDWFSTPSASVWKAYWAGTNPEGYIQRKLSNYANFRKTLKEIADEVGLVLQNPLLASMVLDSERLHNQIIRPDIWFASPPKCNVLFPEDYISYNFVRTFIKEVTRFELTTSLHLLPPSFITKSFYYAPNIKDVTGRYYLKLGASIPLIMPHETLIGIVPAFQYLPSLTLYAAKEAHKKAVTQEELDLLRRIKKEGKEREAYKARLAALQAQSLSFVQRSVNFLFFKGRFGTRQMSVQCRFRPTIAPGFPAALLDFSFVGAPSIGGMVTNVVHSLNQQGGSTQLTITEAHYLDRPDDEYLRVETDAFYITKKGKAKSRTYSTQMLINRVQNPKTSPKLREKAQRLLSYIYAFEKAGGKNEGIPSGPNGETVTVKRIGKIASHIAYKGVRLASRYTIKTSAAAIRFKPGVPLFVPIEEQVYPSWFAPVYRNTYIGKKEHEGKQPPYYQFLGTLAITEKEGEHKAAAIERLREEYLQAAQQGLTQEYVAKYTDRPIATLEQILGTPDLQIDEEGNVTKGTPGFRSLTYAPLKNFKGLEPAHRPMPPQLDRRREKKAVALKIREELQTERAFRERRES